MQSLTECSGSGPSEVSDQESEPQSEAPSDNYSDDEGDEATPQSVRPYNALLQSFQQSIPHQQPPRKKRKINGQTTEAAKQRLAYSPDRTAVEDGDVDVQDQEEEAGDAVTGQQEDASDGADDHPETDEDEELEDASDPFEVHFANPDNNILARRLKAVADNQWETHRIPFGTLGKCSVSIPKDDSTHQPLKPRPITSAKLLKLKNRVIEPAQRLMPEFDALEQALAPYVFDYHDVLFGARTVSNAESLRRLACLHALNHIFKTRDRVIKNNARLAREQDGADVELRDQGFTRPKVLMLLETRQSCVRAVETIMALCEPEQQENKKRFQEAYMQAETHFSDDKPEDFRELFEGNDDNEYRLGMKFTRKTVKYFSQFYNSDIIFASPLGLRRAIESSDPKKADHDFLSSIELVILDQADAMLMQNWEHVESVFAHLNQQPRDAHGCDFSRVRSWYLDGASRHLRQTLVFSAYPMPELNALAARHMRNVAGRLKYQPEYEGAMLHIPLRLRQTFSRYDAASPAADPDARFKYFTTAVVPALARHASGRSASRASAGDAAAAGILIFIPSYLDFVRVRNYFASAAATQHVSFGTRSEYSSTAEARRTQQFFLDGRYSVLLYTGRAHHFRRPRLRGVKRVVMYGLPDNPLFYEEIVGGFLGASVAEGRVAAEEVAVRVLFSRWDSLRLERVVGSKRVAGMVREKAGDTFDFV